MSASLADTPNNRAKAAQARQSLERLIQQATRRGYYGEVRITVAVKDGSLQSIRETTERDCREPTTEDGERLAG